MAEVDVFVILTHCQFEKNGYQNRFNFEDKWYTMGIQGGKCNIADKKYVSPYTDWIKIKDKLPQFHLDHFNKHIHSSLSRTNTEIIIEIARMLKIKTKIISDTHTNLKATERLIDICMTHGATEYLSGTSGKNYMDMNLFKEAGIKVKFQEPTESKPILEVIYA